MIWQTVTFNVSSLQGASIKLRITTSTTQDKVGIDDIGIQSTGIPDWVLTGNAAVIDEGNGKSLSGAGIYRKFSLLPLPLNQGPNIWPFVNTPPMAIFPKLEVSLFTDLNNLTAPTATAVFDGAPEWSTTLLSVSQFARSNGALETAAMAGSIDFDDVGIGKIALHFWDVLGSDVQPLSGAIQPAQMPMAAIFNRQAN
ncbi:MAG: hypothetical protein R2867_01215 [Caldilineaceae bacterium]